MKTFLLYLAAIVIVVGIMVMTISHRINYPDKIEAWAKKESIQIKNMESPWFETGPYSQWSSKHTTIYKVETNRGIYWIRFYHISPEIQDIEKEK